MDASEQDELDDGFNSDSEKDINVFKIRDPLNPPLTNSFTTHKLHTLIHEGQIDLNPPYQREVVWPETKQIHLIDSLFRNFFIPPLVFAVQLDDSGEEVRVCVDGKQRLTSIQKFLDGQIPHKDSVTKKSFWYTRTDAQKNTRLEVPEVWRKQFAEKQIVCVEYRNLAPGTERDIFQRVQLGMSLTAAEKLQAISSPMTEWISDLETRFVLLDNGLSQVLQWDTKRGRDFQCLAQFIYCCDALPAQLSPSNLKMEKFLSRVDPPSQDFKDNIADVLTEFWHLATDKDLNFGFRAIDKRLAPVEFVFIAVLLYVMREQSHDDRANAIYAMRKSVREQFRDIRTNASVGKHLWQFIEKIANNPSTARGAYAAAKKAKRRRRDDEEIEEYRPSAPTRGRPKVSRAN